MKKTISLIIASMMAFCTFAQDIYIGSFYVTTTEEEKLFDSGSNKWSLRMTPICDMFNFEQPDVLGLQSLTTQQANNLRTRMTSFAFAENIFYNKSTVQLDTCGLVTDMPEGSTCSWAKLKKGEKEFYVFNACFSTDTNVANASATRLLGAFSEINTENKPCFVVGFLGVNEKGTTTPYGRIKSRFPDTYTKASVVSAEFGTVNNFDLAANHSTERWDFVLASRNITVKAYGLLQSGYYTKESDGSYKRRLLSAHFPVMVKATLPK